ncbi:MAG: hypothetical protein JNN13_10510 [Planctomycetes bacterium]|nr:hypothetical protein [Planctomycetota bacterium]
MNRTLSLLAAAALVASALPVLRAQTLTVDNQTTLIRPIGATVHLTATGMPGSPVLLAMDVDGGPISVLGLNVPLGLTPAFSLVPIGVTSAAGTLDVDLQIPYRESLHALQMFFATVTLDTGSASGLAVSNGVDVTFVARPQLAGNTLASYPFFEHVAAFNRGAPVQLGIDPRYTFVAGKTADVYVVASKTATQWDLNPALVDARGAAQTVTFPAGATTIQQNTFTLTTGTLPGPVETSASGDTRIGVGYDVVIDFDQDGQFDPGVDLIDGYDEAEAGFYVCRNLTLGSRNTATAQGPYQVTEVLYTGGSFLGQDTYYPTGIASLGQLPLIVISHGNGHNYQWYDHLGYHLASYGYVVMSHENNTVPGSHTAAESTLANTDYLLGHLTTIAGGALNGHIDTHRIVWIGHSRGGDGVARAYDRLFQGTYTVQNYVMSDIKLISSIAPVDFGGWSGAAPTLGGVNNGSHPHDANFHLWVAEADADVNGCVSSPQVCWYGIHERATRKRQSISLYGVGHGDYHDGGGSSVADGPNLIGRAATHDIMRGYVLALVSHHIQGDIPSRDYLWRQYERFRPVGAPAPSASVVANMQFQDDAQSGKYIIDDFQNQATANPQLATSGAHVTIGVQAFVEGRADDFNNDYTDLINDPFNGFIQDDSSTNNNWRSLSYASVFEFDGSGDRSITYDLTTTTVRPALQDYAYLSFRAAQGSRHLLTIAQLGDVTFSVSLEDAAGNRGTVNIGAYGGGIEEPYQRNSGPSCGIGLGWNSEYETIRIRLTDFQNNGSNVDLSNVTKLIFQFGPTYGSNLGRLALDEIELTKK